MDCSPPGSSVHGIFQAKILEWFAISFSRGSSRPRDQTWVSCTAGSFFMDWTNREAPWLLGLNPGGSDSKVAAYNVGDPGSISGLGRSPGEGNGNPLQYSCLENPMDRGALWAMVHGATKSWTWLSDRTHIYHHQWKGLWHAFLCMLEMTSIGKNCYMQWKLRTGFYLSAHQVTLDKCMWKDGKQSLNFSFLFQLAINPSKRVQHSNDLG